MENIYIFLLIIILIILYMLALNRTNNKCNPAEYLENMSTSIKIKEPKHYLWVYWELINGATKPPEYIQLCLDIMKKNTSKTFKMVLLNEKNVFDYIPDLRTDINDLPIALKTDYIRIKLLYLYGGLWMDTDTIVMTDLKLVSDKLDDNVDFISFGCTGRICKNKEGYGKPSNGVIGSQRHGKLITRCLNALDKKMNAYYKIAKKRRYKLNYFELGKMIIWREYSNLMKIDPSYKLYHVPSYADGTRDVNGKWIALDIIFEKKLVYAHLDKLEIIMLANSNYCGKDPKYNWFCGLSKDKILQGNYFISELFRRALKRTV
jgi:hypothetical protein